MKLLCKIGIHKDTYIGHISEYKYCGYIITGDVGDLFICTECGRLKVKCVK